LATRPSLISDRTVRPILLRKPAESVGQIFKLIGMVALVNRPFRACNRCAFENLLDNMSEDSRRKKEGRREDQRCWGMPLETIESAWFRSFGWSG